MINELITENKIEKYQHLFSNEFVNVLNLITDKLIIEYPNVVVNNEYILLAILQEKNSLGNKLISNFVSETSIEVIQGELNDSIAKKAMIAIKPNREINYSYEVFTILDRAIIEIQARNVKKITTQHIIASLLSCDNSTTVFFNRIGLNLEIIYDYIYNTKNVIDNDSEKNDINKKKVNKTNIEKNTKQIVGTIGASKEKSIFNFCENISEKVERNIYPPTIGHKTDLDKIIRILSKQKNNNVIIIGESGVGKTQLCYGLANLINENQAPTKLLGKQIVSIDIVSLIAGSQLRGVFENRMIAITNELINSKKYILYIDDIYSILGDKNKYGEIDMYSLFSDIIENENVQIISTANFKQSKLLLDNNKTFNRLFGKVILEPSSIAETIKILTGLKNQYEKHYGIKYSDEIIETICKLSKKYITDKFLPDSAIDMLDEVGATVYLTNDNKKIPELNRKLIEVQNNINLELTRDNIKRVNELNNEKSSIKNELYEEENKTQDIFEVKPNDVNIVISQKMGIPLDKISLDDRKKLSNINEIIKNKVIGQNDAIDKICQAIKRNRVGLGNPNKPMANILCVGGSGVGKTYLAKQIAKEVFGDESYMVRLDMSEYSEKSAVSKLYGSAPGYIGYDNGGLLTETIKNKKYCVLLLDEIEKGCTEVFNVFLQIFDEGSLTDNMGDKINFKNVIILLTSNVGVKRSLEFGKEIGFTESSHSQADREHSILEKELKATFPPEFINRLDNIVYFNNLSDDNIKDIIKLELNKLIERVELTKNHVIYEDSVIEYIFNETKKERHFGARPILRLIQDVYENQITDHLLNCDHVDGNNFKMIDNKIEKIPSC